MDGFDDLISSSRRGEDNPFDNPFAQARSSSPDPWANPFAQVRSQASPFGTPPAFDYNDDPQAFSNEYDPPAFANETTDSHETTKQDDTNSTSQTTGETVETPKAVTEDELPLKLPDEESEPPPKLGFRQVTVPSLEELKTELVHPESAPVLSSPPSTSSIAALASPTSPAATSPPLTPSREQTPPASSATLPPEPTSTLHAAPPTHPDIISPLTQPEPAHEPSYPNLSIGGESWNSWGAEQDHMLGSAPSSAGWRAPQVAPEAEDDDDDDRPLQAIVDKTRAEAERKIEGAEVTAGSNTKPSESLFHISVDDPQKVGDPIRGYTMYTVHTKTTAPGFRAPSFSVLRRYSDFLWLYETLSLNNPGVVVPPVPEKSPFGRFEDAFVQQRRLGLEKCINKMANHPVLAKDSDLKMFLESDSFALDVKQRKAEIANERGGLMSSFGQSITGPRFHETDEWFEQKKSYLDSLENQLRGFVKAIDAAAKQRAELAAATAEFAARIQEISESDIGHTLSQALVGLAIVERKAEELQSNQSRRDVETILATADEYARLINSVRLAFHSRIRTYHNWQNAETEVRRVKQNHERNRTQGRIPPERMGLAMNLVADAERRVLDTKTEFEQCSRLIKQEVARFETERIGDFKNSLQDFLDGMIENQKQLIATLEKYQQVLLKKAEGDKPGSDGE